MENKENMDNKTTKQNKIMLPILAAVLVLLIVCASFLYDRLGDSVETNPLATQSRLDKATEANTEAPSVSETSDNTSTTSASTESTENSTEQPRLMAYDFTVCDGEGNSVHLSDFFGKPIILNFWASWCGPCKSEMPDFDDAYQEYGNDIHFLMINCTDGYRETVETAKTFISGQGYTFPVYFDTTSEAAYTYGASGIPLSFFIDADGYVVGYWPGMLDRETLQLGIDLIYQP